MKQYWFLIVLLLLILAACGPAETELTDGESEAAPTVEDVATEAVVPTQTAVGAVATATESEPVEEDLEPTAATNSDIIFPATSFGEASLIREGDYFKGAEEPVVEIIEYSDFQ